MENLSKTNYMAGLEKEIKSKTKKKLKQNFKNQFYVAIACCK